MFGFEPFKRDTTAPGAYDPAIDQAANVSGSIAAELNGQRILGTDVEIVGVTFDVVWGVAGAELPALIHQHQPVAILGLGQCHAEETKLRIERQVDNVVAATPYDNRGEQAGRDCVISPSQQPAPCDLVESSFPVDEIVAVLGVEEAEAGTPCSAGTYVCAESMYWTGHLAGTIPFSFIHVPGYADDIADQRYLRKRVSQVLTALEAAAKQLRLS